ncbi:MAG: hypothetical protein C0490_03130 [Marivirga sp.]|nr:hypothetical protein [Marivirga sp.]
MKLSDIKQGTIFQIPLLKDYGYAYALLIQIKTNYDGQTVIDNILQPLDYYSKTSESNLIDPRQLSNVFTQSLLLGVPKIKGKGCWKIVGYRDIKDSDLIKPDFKLCYELNKIRPGMDLSELTWYHVKNLDPQNSKQAEFILIKHLGFFAELNYLLITAKLTIEWMLENEEDINEFFSADDFKEMLGLEMVYAHVLSSS